MKYKLGDLTVKHWNDWDNVPRHPTIVGTAIVSALGLTSVIPAILIPIIGGIAIGVVVNWAFKAMMPDFDSSAFGSSRGLFTNTRSPNAAQEVVYGTVRKGGVVTYLESTGTNNEYLHQIITLAGHEVNNIGTIYINDKEVALDSDGNVTTSLWQDGDGNSTILIKKFEGSPTQNVYTTLNSLTDGNTPDWANGQSGDDTNFRGQGIACLYVRLKYNQDVFTQGVPLFTAVVQGKKVTDPRSGSTAFSANAALCIRDYLTSKYGLNNGGDTNDTVFSAAANTCDEDVTLSDSGTEKRYEINGVLSLDRSPQDILADMVASCAGTLFWGQGQWQLVVGAYSTPVKSFTLDDFRSEVTLETKPSRRDNFNIVRGMFNNAEDDWRRADYPEVRSSTFISDDSGVENVLDFPLPFTTSAIAAQRIAKMTLFRARESMTLSAKFSLKALEVQVGDIIEITNSRYGFSAKDFEVIGWRLEASRDSGELSVGLTLRETSSAAFSWNAEEADLKSNDSNLPSLTDNLTISSLTTGGGGRTQADGTFINSVIVSWTAPNNSFISHYEVEHKATADSSYQSTITPETSIELTPLVDGVEYQIRVRAVTVQGNKGPFATTTFTGGGDTTAPSLPTSISATGGFKFITINWTNPADADLNFVEIYENTTNTSSGATKVGVSGGSTFTRTGLNLNQTRYYFLKAVDFSGNASAFTTGVSATTTYLDDPDFENGIRQIFIDAGLDMIEPVSSLPTSGDFVGQNVYLTTNDQLYAWDGSTWNTAAGGASSFSELSGSIAASQIPDGTIDTAKIADDAITAAKISANAIGANEIAAGAITTNKIAANQITGGLIASSGIITSAAQINDAVITAAKIQDLAVTSAKIGSLDAAKITAGTLDVDRFPALGQANTTVFSNSLTRNGTAASVTVSFSGVKVGADVIVVGQIGGHANNVESPYLRVTPTSSNVTLANTSYRDLKAKEGSITINPLREFQPMVMTGTTTSTSGSVGFSIQLRGNDSGGGGSQGTIAVLVLSG